jgi:KDO2-lipid IV(A) lauroyltransferase
MDPGRRRRLRARVARPALAGLLWLARVLPWGSLRTLGGWLGSLAFAASGVNRLRALDHLALAFPELSERQRTALARSAFRHQVINVLEYLHLTGRGLGAADSKIVEEGWEHVEAARASGRPLLLITGHCGNWELLGAVFGRNQAPLAAVVRKISEPGMEPLVERLRSGLGTRTIARGQPDSIRHLLAALRGGTALMMLIDQDIRTEGVFVPFFGELAHTPAGAARLALRRKAVVIAAFMERREDGSHLARFLPPLELPDDVVGATAVMTRAIEDQIRRRPEQWVWWHRRWRRRPGSG